jgi:hypothetical protein
MGGKLDPSTGKMIWTLHVPVAEQLAHYGAHPPSMLVGLTCTATTLPDVEFDGHGEPVNVLFELACECGGKRFVVVGQVASSDAGDAVDDDAAIASPIEVECGACGVSQQIFDERKHGYDGVQGNNGEAADPVCDGGDVGELFLDEIEAPHYVVVRLEYPSDLLGDPADATWRGHEAEAFSWISILAKDPVSGLTGVLYECECS